MFNYLKNVKYNLIDENFKNKYNHIILGNQSADMDSMVCSIVLAYNFSTLFKEDLVFPIVNCLKSTFKSRKDNIELLKFFKLTIDDLIFIDDFNLKNFVKYYKVGVILVDHNRLSPLQVYLFPFLKFIIDHHPVYHSIDCLSYIKDYVSCATVVSEYLINKNSSILNDNMVRILLFSSIVVDSNNLQSIFTTYKDIYYVNILSTNHAQDFNLFKRLKSKRNDITNLTTNDFLLKDVKFGADNYLRNIFALAIIHVKMNNNFIREAVNIMENDNFFKHISAYFAISSKHRQGGIKLLAVLRQNSLFELEFLIQDELEIYNFEIRGFYDFEYKLNHQTLKVFCFEINRPNSRRTIFPFLEYIFRVYLNLDN